MVVIRASRTIDATPGVIFDAVSNIENLPLADPDVLGVEFLTEQRVGVGTRFRERRRMGKGEGKEMVTELEVTEYETDARVRMVADSHGTVWDTVFTVDPTRTGAALTIAMEARAHKLLPRLMNPLLAGMFRRGIEKHLDRVKARCESAPAQA